MNQVAARWPSKIVRKKPEMMGLKGEGNVREKQAKIVTGAGPESTRKGWRSFWRRYFLLSEE